MALWHWGAETGESLRTWQERQIFENPDIPGHSRPPPAWRPADGMDARWQGANRKRGSCTVGTSSHAIMECLFVFVDIRVRRRPGGGQRSAVIGKGPSFVTSPQGMGGTGQSSYLLSFLCVWGRLPHHNSPLRKRKNRLSMSPKGGQNAATSGHTRAGGWCFRAKVKVQQVLCRTDKDDLPVVPASRTVADGNRPGQAVRPLR